MDPGRETESLRVVMHFAQTGLLRFVGWVPQVFVFTGRQGLSLAASAPTAFAVFNSERHQGLAAACGFPSLFRDRGCVISGSLSAVCWPPCQRDLGF